MSDAIDNLIEDLQKRIKEEISFTPFSDDVKVYIRQAAKQGAVFSQFEFDPEFVTSSLLEKSRTFTRKVIFNEVGTVHHIGNGVANISGLSRIGVDELVKFSTGVRGLVLNLEENSIDVILLGSDKDIHGGDLVIGDNHRLSIPVGPDAIGRILNPLAEPLDGLPPFQPVKYSFLERAAPRIIDRSPVVQSLQTGIKIIDALFPVGRGQRELIVGNRQTGKTTIAMDTIINQKGQGVTCIYVAIGQKKSSVLAAIETLKKNDAMDYTTVIMAGPDDPPALRYLAPFSGCTLAEFFVDQGQDVLIIYDDLSKHADSYRELSLLLRRPPGREAYPGDIFYLHARLLERACKLNEKLGGGSLTALPIITMQKGNIASYIPTNLISICDGQIVLSQEKFNKGFKPAVDIGLSVSRVGGAAQTQAMREVSSQLKLTLSQFEEVERFTQFGTELDEATRKLIRHGQRLQRILTQLPGKPLSLADEVLIVTAATIGFFDSLEMNKVLKYEMSLVNWFQNNHQPFMQDLNREGELSEEKRMELEGWLAEFNQYWLSGEN